MKRLFLTVALIFMVCSPLFAQSTHTETMPLDEEFIDVLDADNGEWKFMLDNENYPELGINQ